MNPIVQVEDLTFAFPGTSFQLQIDQLSVNQDETVALIGPSGSGKTTLLHLLAGIRIPAAGQIVVDGVDVTALDDASLREFRVGQIGMVFQDFELLEHLSVLDNILLPYRISPSLTLNEEVIDRGVALAESVAIGDKTKRFTGRLSQGERQRVAVCRALIAEPRLVFADEPTGNLDPNNKWKVLDILLQDSQRRGSSLITVTHDHELLDRFDRVIDFASLQSERDREPSAESVG